MAYSATALAVLLVPGPAVLYIAARSAAQGRRAGIVSVLGVHAGTLVHIAAAAAGLSALIVASAAAFTTVKVAGGIYLIWLGVKTVTARRPPGPAAVPTAKAMHRLFVDGFTVNVLNPKTALFFLALLPQFVDHRRGPVLPQIVVLGMLYVLLGVCTDGAYAMLGARLGALVTRRPILHRRARLTEGAILVGLGVSALAVPARRS